MFDLVSAKGQDLLTLAGQAALVMPAVAVVFLYVCIGIGLARALRALQLSRQLLVIHTTPRLKALFGAIAVYTGLFTVLVLVARPCLRAAGGSAALRVVGEHRGRSRQPRAHAASLRRDRARA